MRLFVLILLAFLALSPRMADAAERFSFHAIRTVPQMEQYIIDNLPLGSTRDQVQRIFVLQGRATLKNHPTQKNTEKYLFDINLCEYYVFRWNISADYDDKGTLIQAYINGIPVFAEGYKAARPQPKDGEKSKIIRATRDWPQAKKGGRQLQYMLYDADGDEKTVDDQRIVGLGATRVDPADFGEGIRFNDIELWRSIYDEDLSNEIADYQYSCKAADTKYMSRELLEYRHGYVP